eukprot:5115072-Prymnesium_polylepis.1
MQLSNGRRVAARRRRAQRVVLAVQAIVTQHLARDARVAKDCAAAVLTADTLLLTDAITFTNCTACGRDEVNEGAELKKRDHVARKGER